MMRAVTQLAVRDLQLDLSFIASAVCWGMPQKKYVLKHLLSATFVLLLDKPFVDWGMPQIIPVIFDLLFLGFILSAFGLLHLLSALFRSWVWFAFALSAFLFFPLLL